jgi:SAM-dependent methyltransferase
LGVKLLNGSPQIRVKARFESREGRGDARRKSTVNFWRKGKLGIARAMNLDLTHPQTRYARFLAEHVQGVSQWLDVGCGRQIIPPDKMSVEEQRDRFGKVRFLVGIDVDQAILEHPLLSARVIGLCGNLPFAAGTFDLVTANMVVEHVTDPVSFLSDIYRVLRPGGRFIFHTPNSLYYLVGLARLTPEAVKRKVIWGLEQRRDEDIFETHYTLNTPRKVTDAAKTAGFEVEALKVVGGDGSFGPLGPLGWAECVVLKTLSVVKEGQLNSNLIVSLRKPSIANAERV